MGEAASAEEKHLPEAFTLSFEAYSTLNALVFCSCVTNAKIYKGIG